MLDLFFNIIEYFYNNLFYYYYLYVIIYRFGIYIKFYVQYLFSVLNYYITLNKVAINILKPFLLVYYNIRKTFLWLNRRFIKKRKRFRIYYRYNNVRYWKFLLFFFYINVFFFLWKRRNLYRKSQFITVLVFTHILILILLHFFLGLFGSFDIGFLSCILFFFIISLFIRR
jgi:hypothetical protein